jgi:hypothetical protein
MDDLHRRAQMLEALDRLCDQFERDFRAGNPAEIEVLLSPVDPAWRSHWRRCLLEIELEIRCQRGEDLRLNQYLDRFPDARETVYSAFAAVCPEALESSTE